MAKGGNVAVLCMRGHRFDLPAEADQELCQAYEGSMFLLLETTPVGLPGSISSSGEFSLKNEQKMKKLSSLLHGGYYSVNTTAPLSSSLILVENVETNQELKGQYLESCSYAVTPVFLKQCF